MLAAFGSAALVLLASLFGEGGRTIGSFAADPSKHYVLDFDILQDASELDGGHPRLKVEELGGAYLRYTSLADLHSSHVGNGLEVWIGE